MKTESLQGRLSLWLALQTMFGLGIVCAVVYFAIAVAVSQRQDEILQKKRAAIQHLFDAENVVFDSSLLVHHLSDFLAAHEELSLRLIKDDGVPILEVPAVQPILESSKTIVFRVPAPAGVDAAVSVVLRLNKRGDDDLLLILAWTLALAATAGSIVVSVGGFLLVRMGLAPLHVLVAQTKQVTARNLNQRLDGTGQFNELQPLIVQINELLDRISLAYRQMEAFNADVAHELNTPLTTLISGCELALRRPRDVGDLCKYLESNLEELQRLAQIVGDMLFLSNADRGATARRTLVVSLNSTVSEVIEFHEAALLDAGLSTIVDGDAFGDIDVRLVQRAVSNLLANATRYAGKNSTIVVEIVDSDDDVLKISVTNKGALLSPEQLSRIFDRFYRADESRAHGGRNHGLGLAIVSAIARMHDGTVFAECQGDNVKIGFTFRRTS